MVPHVSRDRLGERLGGCVRVRVRASFACNDLAWCIAGGGVGQGWPVDAKSKEAPACRIPSSTELALDVVAAVHHCPGDGRLPVRKALSIGQMDFFSLKRNFLEPHQTSEL